MWRRANRRKGGRQVRACCAATSLSSGDEVLLWSAELPRWLWAVVARSVHLCPNRRFPLLLVLTRFQCIVVRPVSVWFWRVPVWFCSCVFRPAVAPCTSAGPTAWRYVSQFASMCKCMSALGTCTCEYVNGSTVVFETHISVHTHMQMCLEPWSASRASAPVQCCRPLISILVYICIDACRIM